MTPNACEAQPGDLVSVNGMHANVYQVMGVTPADYLECRLIATNRRDTFPRCDCTILKKALNFHDPEAQSCGGSTHPGYSQEDSFSPSSMSSSALPNPDYERGGCEQVGPSGRFVCTRAIGHEGEHRAWGAECDPLFESWPQATPSSCVDARVMVLGYVTSVDLDSDDGAVITVRCPVDEDRARKTAELMLSRAPIEVSLPFTSEGRKP